MVYLDRNYGRGYPFFGLVSHRQPSRGKRSCATPDPQPPWSFRAPALKGSCSCVTPGLQAHHHPLNSPPIRHHTAASADKNNARVKSHRPKRPKTAPWSTGKIDRDMVQGMHGALPFLQRHLKRTLWIKLLSEGEPLSTDMSESAAPRMPPSQFWSPLFSWEEKPPFEMFQVSWTFTAS